MKKTIAKIMAAAMVLSAVPAVALPTLTAEAAGVETVSTVESISSDGATNVKFDAGTKGETSKEDGSLTVGDTKISIETESSSSVATAFKKTLSLSLNNDGYVVVNVAQSTDDDKKAIIAAVKAGDNAITLEDQTEATLTEVIYPGGKINTKTNQIESDITPGDGDLKDGDVYAEIDNSSKLELDIVKGKNDMDDNDDLRGDTLDLTSVKITGVEYDIVKLGAQSLKKAHMKKVVAENVKNVGKGAFRGCKQVKKIDLQDSNKIRKINSKAFYDDKNLNTIIIDGRKLNTVGKNAFAGVKKNCTVKIRAKKSKFNSDVKMIKKNGGNKNLKFVRK